MSQGKKLLDIYIFKANDDFLPLDFYNETARFEELKQSLKITEKNN